MGGISTPGGLATSRPSQGGLDHPLRARRWAAALPFALAWSIAAGMLNASFAPRPPNELRLEQAPPPSPPPPPSAPPTPHEDLVYDSLELINV